MLKKNLFIFMLLNLGCVPFKSAKKIDGFHIVKSDFKEEEVSLFLFQNNKSNSEFKRCLIENFGSSYGVITSINDVDFDVALLTEEHKTKYLDFTSFLFKEKNPELVKNGKSSNIISIAVKDPEGKDALNPNSFYKAMVSQFLDSELKVF